MEKSRERLLTENEELRYLLEINKASKSVEEFYEALKDNLDGKAQYHTNNMSLALEIASVVVKYVEFRPASEGLLGEKGRKKHLKKVFKLVLDLVH